MIRSLTGVVQSIEGRRLVISTSGGLGYLVDTTSRVPAITGESLTLHTHLAVRETALDLYGFTEAADLELFELILTISGIGPKSALQIMEQATSDLLVESIRLSDAAQLSKLSGIGKKTAEKIVLTLKDKIDRLALAKQTSSVVSPVYQDAFDTLVTLGYNPQPVKIVLDGLRDVTTTSQLVKEALQRL